MKTGLVAEKGTAFILLNRYNCLSEDNFTRPRDVVPERFDPCVFFVFSRVFVCYGLVSPLCLCLSTFALLSLSSAHTVKNKSVAKCYSPSPFERKNVCLICALPLSYFAANNALLGVFLLTFHRTRTGSTWNIHSTICCGQLARIFALQE